MTIVLAICVAVIFAVSVYLLLSRELKGVAIGVFLLSHAAHLSILAMSRPPFGNDGEMKRPPILPNHDPMANPLQTLVDPLPQALILTAIVISFAIMGFLLTLLVVTARKTGTLEVDELAIEEHDEPHSDHPDPLTAGRPAAAIEPEDEVTQ